VGKGIGFNRNIKLEWLNATAAFCAEADDPTEIRTRLEPILSQDRTGVEAIRKSIDILINIWLKSREIAPDLQQQAVTTFQETTVPDDRIWLHCGLTMLTYPFFRQCTTAIGQLGRHRETFRKMDVFKRLSAERGQLGSLERSVRRVISSLRSWGILVEGKERYTYCPRFQSFGASQTGLEAWLLACAMQAHPVEELPFNDLIALPALFPFYFTITVNDLRDHPSFEIQRQGISMDMVRCTL
jgi:hypothetical protein